MAQSSATATVTTISDPRSIKAWNRGPITKLSTPPASCTATLTTQQPGQGSKLFFGHYNDAYLDTACYPMGTLQPTELFWDKYYCV